MIAIAGVPKSGKTTLSHKLDCCPRGTDSTIDMEWSEGSTEVSTWFNDTTISTIEGVSVPRALRKWLKYNSGKPVEILIYLYQPIVKLSIGQRTMGNGCWTVFNQILPDIMARNVDVYMLGKGKVMEL